MTAPTTVSASLQTPTELNELRTSVERWLERARSSLLTFLKDDATFLLDSDDKGSSSEPFNTTTTARAYKALVCCEWRIEAPKLNSQFKTVGQALQRFLAQHHYVLAAEAAIDKESLKDNFFIWDDGESVPSENIEKRRLNNFDVVHLSDYIYAFHRIKTYEDETIGPEKLYGVAKEVSKTGGDKYAAPGEARARNFSALSSLIVKMLDSVSVDDKKFEVGCGRILLDPGTESSGHFFVTLHALRALSILERCQSDGTQAALLSVEKQQLIADACKRFCMEQCFYASRESRHEFDCTSLTFALVIYTKYSENCDKDLIKACMDAIANAQAIDGAWPATHPIMRKGNKPWHITSHELALSLSWLYFEPQLPDVARVAVLGMLEKYFKNWVLRTHVRAPSEAKKAKAGTEPWVEGWFDDHTITRDTAAGWVTAIVCDFLGNYHNILCDYINRRVIQTLGIETSAADYLIDEDATEPAAKWQSERFGERKSKDDRTRWPDLPPLSWPTAPCSREKLADQICMEWSDPARIGEGTGIAFGLTEHLDRSVNKPSQKLPDDARLFLLPGPPGTRKTSLVKAIPKIAKWPFVSVPAATFFEDGFDHLLTRATNVFRNLGYLRNCVVFFDEFEEFFRERFGSISQKTASDKIIEEVKYRIGIDNEILRVLKQSGGGAACGSDREFHDRTIAAFITSSMLPHLQLLHDDGYCLVFVATNSEETIDRAIQRPGRFDWRVEVPHPTLSCLKYFLLAPTKKTLSKRTLKKCEIDIPSSADTTLKLGDIGAWKVIALRARSVLDEAGWKKEIFTKLKEEVGVLKAAERSKKKAKDNEKIKALNDLTVALNDASRATDTKLRVPFRDFEKALQELATGDSRKEKSGARNALMHPLDDQVLGLSTGGKP